MADLFSMFLNSAVSWGVGRILNTITGCPICGQKREFKIGNLQRNYIDCNNCKKGIEQFTNACDFTVNRDTREIGHAIFSPGQYLWNWTGGFIVPSRLNIPFNICVRGLRGRTLVFETDIRYYDDNRLITSYSSLLNVTYDIAQWSNLSHNFGEGWFKKDVSRIIFAVDARIRTEYRDILFEDRRIIKPWG